MRLGGIRAAAVAALTVVALASVSAAEAATRSSAALGLVTTQDVAGLAQAAVPSVGRRAWSALLPASARVSAVGLLRGPNVAIVSRAVVTRSPAAVARMLRRLSSARLARLDVAALGHSSVGPGKAHAVWSAGSWVGQVSVLGAGRVGAALARSAAAAVRARIQATLAKTAWDKVLDQVRPDGGVSVSTALQAFSLAIARLPGVRVPAGPVGPIPDGTLAINWVLSKFAQLSPAQRAAVTKALDGLHGTPQHVFRRLADLSPVCEKSGDWKQDATDQQMAEQEASDLTSKLNLPLTLTLCVGVGTTVSPTAFAETEVLNASGDWQTGPAADCWITVNPGLKKTGVYLREILAHEVFHCYQGQIADLPYSWILPEWVSEGGANWAACNVVPGALPDKAWTGYLKSPTQRLFERSYDALGFFSLLSQHGIDVWSRWPAIILAARTASFPAYANAVGAEEETILSDWATSYAQDASRGADWDVAGPCKPADTNTPPAPASVANGSVFKLVAPTWTVALVTPFSSADVIRVEVGSGSHVRLSSADPKLDERLVPGEFDYCTSPQGNCSCPGGEKLDRINPDGGTLIALTGGPTGAEATVTGMSLGDFCNHSAGSCSLLSAKQVRVVLGLANATVLDTPVYSSPTDPDLNFGCEIGAWNGSKPTSAAQVLQRARSGKAAQVAYETWVQGTGRNAGEWPAEFQQLAQAFSQGVIPNLSAPGPPGRFSPASYGYATAGVTTKLGPPYVGLSFAGACWWSYSTLSATCLGDWEATGKPVVAHLTKLAAIAIPNSLG